MGYTHLAAGAYCGALAGSWTGDAAVGMAVGAIAGLLPDIDHPGSLLGRRLKPVSYVVAAGTQHRGFTHTLWFCIGAALAAMAATAALGRVEWADKVGLFVLVGCLSHLVLDALTISGVRPFALPRPICGLLLVAGKGVAGLLPQAPPGLVTPIRWIAERLTHVKGPVQTGSMLVEGPLTLVLVVLTLQTLKII